MPIICALLLLAPVTFADPVHHFESRVVWSCSTSVFSLDPGDLVPQRAGPEVAVLDSTGAVYLLTPQPGIWVSEPIIEDDDAAYSMYHRPTVAVGELLPESNGEEVAVMSCTHLNVAHRSPAGDWSWETIFSSDGMIGHAWGARTGDYLPSSPGEEIFLIYEGVLDASIGTVCYRLDQTWALDVVYHAEVGMDSAAGEYDPTQPGPEVVVTTEMGPTYLLRETGTPPYEYWPLQMIWLEYENAGWVCAIDDVDESNPGNEVVYGTRYTNSILLSRFVDYYHQVDLIFTGQNNKNTRNMWDVDTGDVLSGGVAEIVGVDNTGRVYLVWREEGQWRGETIWTDSSGAVYAVVVDDFDPGVPGDEILVAGYSGDLTLLVRNGTTAVDPAAVGSSLTCSPNPFNPRTTISYSLQRATTVGLQVFDVTGRLVNNLLDGATQNAGVHAVIWTGRDNQGRVLPSGTYFYRLTAAGHVAIRSVTLVR